MMSIVRELRCKLNKRQGAALLGIVLVSFILLTIFSLVAFNIAINTMKVENWQRGHFESQQMNYLARAAIIIAGKTLSDDMTAADMSKTVNRVTCINIADKDKAFAASVDLLLSGDANAGYVNIKAAAYAPLSAASNDTKSIMSAKFSKSSRKLFGWDEGE